MKTAVWLIALTVLALCIPSVRADSVLRPGDSFELRIGGVPSEDQGNISSNYTVDGEGCVNLPYIGKVSVARLTASAIQSAIERAYVAQGIFTHPTITLSIAAAARYVNVAGSVKSPGRIAYSEDMTVMTAINAAGDFNDFAKPSGTQLTRDGRVIKVDCKQAKKDPSKDIKVLPGDQIFVPQSFF